MAQTTIGPATEPKKSHFLVRLLVRKSQPSKRGGSLLPYHISYPLESRPSYAGEPASLSALPRTCCNAIAASSTSDLRTLSLPRRFQSPTNRTTGPGDDSHVFTPTKLISVAGSPSLTPVKQVGPISFDDLIDERSRNVTIKLSMTPQVAM
ncbi:hypothetical protein IWQ60_006614 [Tieghemiomyces parasiticus]|uniref:Uncharacterized protein n=1 Tax=Tieghemiomyces parasiticus TaxID=78921 RepID=A0A9W8A937_9FUNG|nr:hypothetical protein IWQ60_006614 [Tieghemiomyces parasiticus]